MKIFSTMNLVITMQIISSILSGNTTYTLSQFVCTNDQSNMAIVYKFYKYIYNFRVITSQFVYIFSHVFTEWLLISMSTNIQCSL